MVKNISLWWVGICLAVLAQGCVRERELARPLPAPHLHALSPRFTVAGERFNVQPDGVSALSVQGANLFRGCRVRFHGELLETVSGVDSRYAAAVVPPRLFAKPGVYSVWVELADGTVSNPLPFTVLPPSGPAPQIKTLYPDSTTAGQVFNPQPRGGALSVTGANFLPGAVVLFAGERLLFNREGDCLPAKVEFRGALWPGELFPRVGFIVTNLGNLWRRVVLRLRVGKWSLTSLQQRLVKTGGG